MSEPSRRSRWVAIVTGVISIAIAVAYLALITVLDARGPLLPPPPEALGQLPPLQPSSSAVSTLTPPGGGAVAPAAVAGVPPRG
ncbi:MAG: hypothetical protein ACKO0M_15230 [Cyanobium sp.]